MMDWSRLRWVLQSNLGNARDLEALGDALDAIGVRHEHVCAIPFSSELPDVSSDGLTVFYGATTLIQNVVRSGRFSPGAFFDEARFDFETLKAEYGAHLLNADAEVTSVASLAARDLTPEAEFFVRPAADGKEFSGTVMAGAELREWLGRVGGSDGALSENSRVILASPKPVAREWRVILVGGRPVGWSRYRSHLRLDVSAVVPDAVLEFAATMAEVYAPAEVFTLDVGDLDGTLKVIETNCFNSSGFYACDLRAVVRAVSGHVLRRGALSERALAPAIRAS